MAAFTGIPVAALDFYEDLEADNSKTWWAAHKETYDEVVRRPMASLTAALEDEFGAAKLFRPYRDVRFSKDKIPYKTHQGAFVGLAESCGYYVQIDAAWWPVVSTPAVRRLSRVIVRLSTTTFEGRSSRRSWPPSRRPDSRSAATSSRRRLADTRSITRESTCCDTSRSLLVAVTQAPRGWTAPGR